MRNIASIFLFSLLCMLPLLLFGFWGLDVLIHGIWVKDFSELLGQGIIFPKFGHKMYQEMGSYTYFFYPPMNLYISSAFSYFASDEHLFSQALLGSAFVATFITGINCYLWLANRIEKKHALLLTFFYVVSAASMMKFYLTAQMGMIHGCAWYPLVFLGLDKIKAGKRNGFLVLALAQAFIFLSNIPAAMIFLPFAGLYFLFQKPNLKQAAIAGAASILALGIAAYFLLPMILLKDQVYIDVHWDKKYGFYYTNFFLNYDYTKLIPTNPQRAVVLMIEAILLLQFIYAIYKRDKNNNTSNSILFVAFAAIFLTTDLSKPIWDILPIIQTVQFPDRFQIVATIFLTLALSMDFARYRNFVICSIIAMLAMLFIFKFNNQVDFASLSESTKAQYKNRVIAFPDYQPKAPEMLQHFHFPAQENIKQLPHAEFAKGAGKIGEVVWNNRDLSVNYSATKNSALKVNRFYIQGWQAEINGKPAAIKFEDKMGVMLIDAQKCSDCTLKIWLPMLPSEKLGYIISAISLFVFAASGFYSYRVRKLA